MGVSRTANAEQIKEAFKKLAVKYHPDKNPGDTVSEEIFKEISHAYDVLSNPEKKARYDLTLNYSESTSRYSTSSTSNPYAQPQYNPYRHRPKPKKYHHDFGWTYIKHQMYAFGFVFVVAIFVLTFQGVYNYLEEKEKARIAAIRQEKMEAAIVNFRSGKYQAALDTFQVLIKEFPGVFELRQQKTELLKVLKFTAESQFQNQQYEKAADNFALATVYEDPYLLNQGLYFRLATCYEHIGKFTEAAEVLNLVLINDDENIELNMELGRLYRDKINDLSLSLRYYTIARNRLVRILSSAYGSAYELVLNPKRLPDFYYKVYHGRALTNQAMGNHEEAIKDLNWAIFFDRENGEDYFLRGNSFLATGNRAYSCRDWNQALDLEFADATQSVRRYCN